MMSIKERINKINELIRRCEEELLNVEIDTAEYNKLIIMGLKLIHAKTELITQSHQ